MLLCSGELDPKKLYLTGLPKECTEDTLKAMFPKSIDIHLPRRGNNDKIAGSVGSQLNTYEETQKINMHFLSFLNFDVAQVVEILPHGRQGHILPSQYHGCRWPGNTRSHGISCHDNRTSSSAPEGLSFIPPKYCSDQINGLVQDFSISNALALEILHSY